MRISRSPIIPKVITRGVGVVAVLIIAVVWSIIIGRRIVAPVVAASGVRI